MKPPILVPPAIPATPEAIALEMERTGLLAAAVINAEEPAKIRLEIALRMVQLRAVDAFLGTPEALKPRALLACRAAEKSMRTLSQKILDLDALHARILKRLETNALN